MIPRVTMLELVQTVMDLTQTDAEVIATVVDLVNSGKVQLIGNFRGCKIAVDGYAAAA
jgi:hypothetical protein